jgi:hypothetical protein
MCRGEKTDKHIWDNQRTSIDKTACEISVNHLKQQAKDLLKPNQPTSQPAKKLIVRAESRASARHRPCWIKTFRRTKCITGIGKEIVTGDMLTLAGLLSWLKPLTCLD